jgi:hypothetical protein
MARSRPSRAFDGIRSISASTSPTPMVRSMSARCASVVDR